MGLRVHRAISWIGRAEAAGDDDARFLFLWIGFNSAYADEEELQNAAAPERDAFKDYFQKVVRLDAGQRIYDAIWDNFSGPIRVLLHNKYVFTPFWKHHDGVEGFEDWEEWFRASERRFRRALDELLAGGGGVYVALDSGWSADQITRRSSLSSRRVYSGNRPESSRLSSRMMGTPSPRRSIM